MLCIKHYILFISVQLTLLLALKSDSIDNIPIINNECYEPKANKTYKVGDIWNTTEMCEIFRCEMMEITPPGRKLQLAVGVRKICASIGEKKSENCFLVPKQHGIFPFCCPILVCVRENDIEIHYSYDKDIADKNNTEKDNIQNPDVNAAPTTMKLKLTSTKDLPTIIKGPDVDNKNLTTNSSDLVVKQRSGIEFPLVHSTDPQVSKPNIFEFNDPEIIPLSGEINDTLITESTTFSTTQKQKSNQLKNKKTGIFNNFVNKTTTVYNEIKNKSTKNLSNKVEHTINNKTQQNDSFSEEKMNKRVYERIIDYFVVNDTTRPLITIATNIPRPSVHKNESLDSNDNIKNQSGQKMNTSNTIFTISVILAALSFDPIILTIWPREQKTSVEDINDTILTSIPTESTNISVVIFPMDLINQTIPKNCIENNNSTEADVKLCLSTLTNDSINLTINFLKLDKNNLTILNQTTLPGNLTNLACENQTNIKDTSLNITTLPSTNDILATLATNTTTLSTPENNLRKLIEKRNIILPLKTVSFSLMKDNLTSIAIDSIHLTPLKILSKKDSLNTFQIINSPHKINSSSSSNPKEKESIGVNTTMKFNETFSRFITEKTTNFSLESTNNSILNSSNFVLKTTDLFNTINNDIFATSASEPISLKKTKNEAVDSDEFTDEIDEENNNLTLGITTSYLIPYDNGNLATDSTILTTKKRKNSWNTSAEINNDQSMESDQIPIVNNYGNTHGKYLINFAESDGKRKISEAMNDRKKLYFSIATMNLNSTLIITDPKVLAKSKRNSIRKDIEESSFETDLDNLTLSKDLLVKKQPYTKTSTVQLAN